ncbi:helix-turn-helix transcriptional regulator [Chryseobacterium sp. MHB01]|uniref:helix-turn-helix domain-containing protein n=1 Tax=Chryseobacterium sp. MHB01 TaxID=3109433 RepID=UPI002AFE4380|nr:helix-turn-helix transcriptional regulator [Chryseobacterium sp. MHB01]MEA1849205.1 helix-turn-helix transcriptional regulator [Chryseobacterium sp. MHB01]
MLRVQEVLREKEISQIDLATKMKVTKEGLNKQINGNPTIKSLIRIAKAIDVDVRELIIPTKNIDKEEIFIRRNDQYIPLGKISIDKITENKNPQS